MSVRKKAFRLGVCTCLTPYLSRLHGKTFTVRQARKEELSSPVEFTIETHVIPHTPPEQHPALSKARCHGFLEIATFDGAGIFFLNERVPSKTKRGWTFYLGGRQLPGMNRALQSRISLPLGTQKVIEAGQRLCQVLPRAAFESWLERMDNTQTEGFNR